MTTTNGTATITLPGGVWMDGSRHQQASLHPLTGADEAFLLDLDPAVTPARRTTQLLARCVTRIGPQAPVTEQTLRSLSVGDREALLLHLRRLTLGDRLQCVLDCDGPECGERMDVELRVEQLLLPPYEDAAEWYEATLERDSSSCRVRFRVPQGGDQEDAAELARCDQRGAVRLVLERCVQGCSTDDQHAVELPAWAAAEVAALMARRDPQGELLLSLACPACGRDISALLDAGTFFFRDLAMRVKHLYREVHLLAFHYHWSEAEIMAMTATKRQRYLQLLDETLNGGSQS